MHITSVMLRLNSVVVASLFFIATCASLPGIADARQAEGRTRTSINRGGQNVKSRDVSQNRDINRTRDVRRDTNVNRNVNINKNVNVNVKGDGRYYYDGRHYHYDHHYHHHDVGRAWAIGALTGLVVGTIIASSAMSPSCGTMVVNGISYRQCGNTWYQPHYAGSQVNYIVVNRPY